MISVTTTIIIIAIIVVVAARGDDNDNGNDRSCKFRKRNPSSFKLVIVAILVCIPEIITTIIMIFSYVEKYEYE